MQRRLVFALLAAVSIAACSGRPFEVSPPPASGERGVRQAGASGDYLFVADWKHNKIDEYSPHSDAVTRTIGNGIDSPTAIAVDRLGNLLVVNDSIVTGASVTVYPPKTTVPTTTIKHGIDAPRSIAADSAGDIYVANVHDSRVTVYAPGGDSVRTITHGIDRPVHVAFDSAGNLYVVNSQSVSEYAPGKSTASRVIRVPSPRTIAFDRQNDVYIGTRYSTVLVVLPPSGTEALYAIHMKSPPYSVALDRRDNVFVANEGAGKVVTVYKAKSDSVARTIEDGISVPTLLATDSKGYLYVLNGDSITEYGPGASTPAASIKVRKNDVTALALGSQ